MKKGLYANILRRKRLGITASELNVARQLLKDNGIDAVPVEGSPLKSLLDELPFKEPIKLAN